MGQVEVDQVVDRRAMRMRGERRHDSEYHGQHDQVVAIDPERSLPEFVAHPIAVFLRLVDIQSGHQHGGQKNEALGRGNKPKGLIDQFAKPRRQVGQRHPDQEKSAQGVQLGTALYLAQPEYFPRRGLHIHAHDHLRDCYSLETQFAVRGCG